MSEPDPTISATESSPVVDKTPKPRPTDTREKAMKIAREMLARGEKPTSYTVRKLVGYGSYETIGEAISKVVDAIDQSELPKPSGISLLTEARITSLIDMLETAIGATTRSGALIADSASHLRTSASAGTETLKVLRSASKILGETRQSIAQNQDLAHLRFDAVRRYSLREVEAARRKADSAVEELKEARQVHAAKEQALVGRNNALAEKVANLEGQLEALERLVRQRIRDDD